MRTSIITLLLHICWIPSIGQAKEIRQVLKNNIPNEDYIYDIKDKEKTTYIIRYLGEFKAANKTRKFANLTIMSFPYGSRKRHTHGILTVYDSTNQFIGAYDVSDPQALPDHIKGTTLVFTPYDGCTATTVIDFKNGLTEDIFIRCTKRGGDIYSLSTFIKY